MKNNSFKTTVVEKIIIFILMFIALGFGAVVYVIWHFLSKVW